MLPAAIDDGFLLGGRRYEEQPRHLVPKVFWEGFAFADAFPVLHQDALKEKESWLPQVVKATPGVKLYISFSALAGIAWGVLRDEKAALGG